MFEWLQFLSPNKQLLSSIMLPIDSAKIQFNYLSKFYLFIDKYKIQPLIYDIHLSNYL